MDIKIKQLLQRKQELEAALEAAQRSFYQIDGRLQEIDQMIDYCKQNETNPAQTGNLNLDVNLDEGEIKTTTTP
jgi:hypothetical protein